MHATIKAILSERLGIDCGDPRLPTPPLTSQQRSTVLKNAEALGLTRVAVAQAGD